MYNTREVYFAVSWGPCSRGELTHFLVEQTVQVCWHNMIHSQIQGF